jgi:hypothetical protein
VFLFGVVLMKRCFSAAVSVALALLLAGCGPASSFSPLFNKGDQELDERLTGEWRIQGEASFKHGEKSARMVFRKGADGTEYEVTLFNFDEKGLNLVLTAHLVRLDNFSFIDFGTPDTDKRKFREIPFPAIESHFFGRIHLDNASVRIDLLSDNWVKKQGAAGKTPLPAVQTADGLAISASTEELRKFALEHAEDTEAFSDSYSLSRTK